MKRVTGGAGVRQVPLTQVRESPLNPRRLFNPTELEELAASIRKRGVIQPLVVRQVKGGAFELIAGARRLRAAALAKLTTVPIVVREATDDEVLDLMLIENLQRSDLNAVDECEGYWRLVKQSGYTGRRIAEEIGKSESYVSARMKLRDLVPEAIAALAEGRITPSHAIELSRAPATAQKKALKVRAENQGPSQMTLSTLKATLRPTETRHRDNGAVYDVVSRCWLCNGLLEFNTDGIGRTIPGCPPCLKRLRGLEDDVRRLTKDLSRARAEAAA